MTMPLRCSDQGTGVPVVLVHAFPLSSAMWEKDAERFARLARVITPDLPGFGGSPRQPHPSIAAMAQALAGLLEHLKIQEPVVLAGLSMGGYVAFEFLRRFPARVKALALFSTKAAADSPKQREARFALIERIRRDGREALLQATLPKLVGAATTARRPAVIAQVERFIRAADLEGVIDAVRAMAERADARPLLASLACPTLVISGSEDQLIPVQEGRLMADAIPGARFQVIPEAGHLTNLEQPEAFQAAVEDWLRQAVRSSIPKRCQAPF